MGFSNEQVIMYRINGRNVHIYGCWDKETPENEFDFYDLYINDICINLGCPFYKKPSKKDVTEFIKDNNL